MTDLLHAPATLSAAGALLRRLQARLQAHAPGHRVLGSGSGSCNESAEAGGTAKSCGSGGKVSSGGNTSYGSSSGSGGCSGGGGGKSGNPNDAAIAAALVQLFPKAAAARRRVPRYPTRVFLASYMIRVSCQDLRSVNVCSCWQKSSHGACRREAKPHTPLPGILHDQGEPPGPSFINAAKRSTYLPARHTKPRIMHAPLLQEHAMAVFNTWGERERRLAASARRLSVATDALLAALLAPRPHGGAAGCNDTGSCAFGGTEAAAGGSGGISGSGGGICSEELAAFDGAWAEYVGLFAAWKGRDAAALEVEPSVSIMLCFDS